MKNKKKIQQKNIIVDLPRVHSSPVASVGLSIKLNIFLYAADPAAG